jgi:hypothetical protein
MTEEMAKAMAPDAKDPQKNETLIRMAKICKKGKEYKIAATMMIQAGLKLKAMKIVIKSGDVEMIKSFA